MTTWRTILPTVLVSVALTGLTAWLIAYGSYRVGYRDGVTNRPPLSQTEVDAQCSAWWTGDDMKETKRRLCGSK